MTDPPKNALRGFMVLLAGALLFIACSERSAPTQKGSEVPTTVATTVEGAGEVEASPTAFVNKVWQVSESPDVAAGTLYVFLSEGTLVVASPNGKPALGTWKYEGDAFTLIEEGISYKVDVLKLTKDEFRIRSNNPGKPVEIALVAAEHSGRHYATADAHPMLASHHLQMLCDGESFRLSFESNRATVESTDGATLMLARLNPEAEPESPRVYSNGTLTFVHEAEGGRVLFARGRRVPQPCVIARNAR